MQVKLKKCKNCGEDFKQYNSLDKCPNYDCRKALMKNKKSSPAKKKKRIKPISDSMAEKLVEYRKVRDKYMSEHITCEFEGCNKDANDLHHKASRGKHLSDVTTFMAVCRLHHNWIHEHPLESRGLGYLI